MEKRSFREGDVEDVSDAMAAAMRAAGTVEILADVSDFRNDRGRGGNPAVERATFKR